MEISIVEPPKLSTDALVKDLLTVTPMALIKADIYGGLQPRTTLTSVGALVRRVLERVLQTGDQRELRMRLSTATSPAAAVDRLETLLAWAFVHPYRRQRNLPFATLDVAGKGVGDRTVAISQRLREMSVDELIDAYYAQPADIDYSGFTKVENVYPVSVAGALEDILRLEATTIYFYRSVNDWEQDENERVRIGLQRLTEDVLSQFKVMRERRTTVVRLMSESDAKDAEIGPADAPSARAGQIATILAAGMHALEGNDVSFLAPRGRSASEGAMLREAAKLVYLDHSDEAMRGLELICDGFTHFGHGFNRTLAQRLLIDVARECDPELQRMPHDVAAPLSLQSIADIANNARARKVVDLRIA